MGPAGGGPSVVACHVNLTVICVVVVTELASAWCLLACDWWILVQCDNLSCDAKNLMGSQLNLPRGTVTEKSRKKFLNLDSIYLRCHRVGRDGRVRHR